MGWRGPGQAGSGTLLSPALLSGELLHTTGDWTGRRVMAIGSSTQSVGKERPWCLAGLGLVR